MDIRYVPKDEKDFAVRFTCPNCELENISESFSLSDCEHLGSGYKYVVKCVACGWRTATYWKNSQIEEISEP